MIRRPPRSTLFPYPTLFRSRAAIERAVDVLVALHTAGSVHGKGVEVQERVLSGERLTFPSARGAELRDGLATSCDRDRKSTRLNSSHLVISYAVFCLKKKKN